MRLNQVESTEQATRKRISISGNQPSPKSIDQSFCIYDLKQDKKKSRIGISISKYYLHNPI